MNSFTQIKTTKNLGEQAYEVLREWIITLNLEPGQTIFESEVAETLSISRTPIRDAFHSLISEQLVEVLPQRTKRIALISEEKVKESAFVRLSLESSAFRFVTKEWKDTDKYSIAEKQIHQILKEQKVAAEQQDVYEFLKLDEAFHRTILQLAENKTLLQVVYHMRGHLDRFRYLAMKELELTQHLVEEHEELFLNIRNRNEERVVGLLERHMGNLDSEITQLREKVPNYFAE